MYHYEYVRHSSSQYKSKKHGISPSQASPTQERPIVEYYVRTLWRWSARGGVRASKATSYERRDPAIYNNILYYPTATFEHVLLLFYTGMIHPNSYVLHLPPLVAFFSLTLYTYYYCCSRNGRCLLSTLCLMRSFPIISTHRQHL